MKPDVSVVITTFSEGRYLDSLLEDIAGQVLEGVCLEVLLVEAGNYSESRAKSHLGPLSDVLTYFHEPGMSRTMALNKLFDAAKGELIVRLDARSHVDNRYLLNLRNLSLSTNAENVGGVMRPIGLTKDQQLIAEIMIHPASFGGAKSRSSCYSGYVDSVYLGAFNALMCKRKIDQWFDSLHPKISEDSDLNFRLRQAGGKVYIESSIIVYHYPRESLSRFFRLCYNYGVGRGLFLLKHRAISAYRQLVPPFAFLVVLTFICLGFFYIQFAYISIILVFLYVAFVMHAVHNLGKDSSYACKAFIGFIGCHLFWTIGLISSPMTFFKDSKLRK
jgi:succinoglycan biosynthesis protein ExoA